MLGKKTNIESKEAQKQKIKFLNNNIEKVDAEFNSSEEELISADKSFSIESFLIGAEKAFRIIVSSYKENNIESAEGLLSPKVLKAFQARIKVKFLSTQENKLDKKEQLINVKDIWTFEKIIGSKDPTWILTEVTSE